ncbi:hypothetical protein FB45DRAFT_26117 [Roridomyces roridus]|uniref:Fe2OG dioxygenase domain-containing protein n=1 Tax=Roridomyces roridus TaxID=1738132 RepID=A0AAD7CK20_9AGAR|nr:hypothetical protein FB45DRAFT_26117 [Roridomyces roridus]
MTSIDDQLKALRETLTTQVPYTSGTHAVKEEDLILFYEVPGEDHAHRVDLGRATEADLAALTVACQKATFGVGGKDVLDESYRKAAKMDANRFSLRFDVTALLNTITPELLHGQHVDEDNSKVLVLRAEMYKLNVYGPGSFFKAHKDTPRGEDMIGSLVLVFPTAHEGGALSLEHDGKKWVCDSAAEIAAAPQTPALAYVAFYSDVTHAVETVRTGYRVTLTYNLYLSDRHATTAGIQRRVLEPEQAFERTLRALLADPTFLPKGGLLAYSLAHQYPLPAVPDSAGEYSKEKRCYEPLPSRLPRIVPMLKGSDARILATSERVGLTTHLKVLYGTDRRYEQGYDVLTDDVLNIEHVYDYEGFGREQENEIIKMGARLNRDKERVEQVHKKIRESDDYDPEEDWEERDLTAQGFIDVHWVTRLTELNQVRSSYVAYGNEPSLGHVYGNAALFVDVPAAGQGVRA